MILFYYKKFYNHSSKDQTVEVEQLSIDDQTQLAQDKTEEKTQEIIEILDLAKKLSAMFLEVVVAPSFDKDALEELKKKKNPFDTQDEETMIFGIPQRPRSRSSNASIDTEIVYQQLTPIVPLIMNGFYSY